ncbi:AEC family transporter [uncultured Dysosmobacter sp.]|uniref:AEC family transporter n=1 Tax=uncultured Dysosmobacter sp. TaxID=2591384 RepID=UPI00262751E1|nr:AEC family transporter [uncultured Dysosmobacter sp.]
MSFIDTFSEMLILLFAMAIGYLAHRLGYLGEGIDARLSKLILNITLPAMIVGSVVSGSALPGTAEILSTLRVAAVFYGIQLLAAFAVPRFLGGTPGQKGVWRYGLVFSNLGFIGYPVVISLFGADKLFYAVILQLPFNMLSYTLGPLMLAGAKQFRWKQFLSPSIIASVIALTIALTGVRVPAQIGDLMNFVGDLTVPLSLLVVGSLLAGLPDMQALSAFRFWALSVLRLLVLPVLLWLILRQMDVDPVVQGIAVIEMAMPVAVNGSMLCLEYGGDTETMAQVIFITTLLSIVTIPLVAMVLL